MSSAMATQQFAANVLRTGARKAGRTAPVRANRMTVRAAASNGGLPIDLRGALPDAEHRLPEALARHATACAHRVVLDPISKLRYRTAAIGSSRVLARRTRRRANTGARAKAKNRTIRFFSERTHGSRVAHTHDA
jgi:hypothetical protein